MAGTSSASSLKSEEIWVEDKGHHRNESVSVRPLQKRLLQWRLGSSEAKTQVKSDVKGPLGLNLLHEPSEPRFDFVFIHGLLGGSKKTWSHVPEPGFFWPKDWLPHEPGFEHVRVHSYGYNSDWTTKKESHLSIHDFGQALLADLYNSPHLRKTPETPIVFIAHSMGGLVAKKAYLLAHDDPIYQAVGRRIQCLYFLGTPHRGSALARVVRLMCQSIAYGPKAFVNELVPGSQSLEDINDEFRKRCGNIGLWSFFEGAETSSGPVSMLVVDKESAVIGLPGEHVQYIEADHRHICKFQSRTDPNYLILQRCLLTTLEELEAKNTVHAGSASDMTSIAAFLSVGRDEDMILTTVQRKQQPGSCQWLASNDTFQKWLSSNSSAPTGEKACPNILWLSGRPGTGKSVTMAHVVKLLADRHFDCGFYFFRHNDRHGSSVCSSLRSIALQMAQTNPQVRQALLSMVKDEIPLNRNSYHDLWKKVFLERILKIKRTSPFIWVIDAIDECPKAEIADFVLILEALSGKAAAKVFLTARPGGELGKCLSRVKVCFSEISIGQDQTMEDIELYLAARCSPEADPRYYPELVSEVLSSCRGIFLWASLIVAELEDAYTIEDMREILRNMPIEMDGFYTRILNSIIASPNWTIVQCVLKWVVCSIRPLTIAELVEAVKLDIGRTLTATPSQIQAITGHLITVDQQGRVQIIHETAAAFLTRERDEFWIDKTAAHSWLSETCLGVLCGPGFQPPRSHRDASTRIIAAESALSHYAGTYVYDHLLNGFPDDEKLCSLVDKFLRTNSMTWVEWVARTGDLGLVLRGTHSLKFYLRTMDSERFRLTSQIADEISRVVDAFHTCLTSWPPSAHFLIPHLCPRSSVIRKIFARDTGRLRITSTSHMDGWSGGSDRYLFWHAAISLACSGRILAVGLYNGSIEVYRVTSYGTVNIATLQNWSPQPRLLLALDSSSKYLAACSRGILKVWDVRRLEAEREQHFRSWIDEVDFEPSDLRFSHDGGLLMVANASESSIVTINLAERGSDDYEDDAGDYATTPRVVALGDCRRAATIRFDDTLKLAAVCFTPSYITVRDVETCCKLGDFNWEKFGECDETSPTILDVTFRPSPSHTPEQLAVTYGNGDVIIVDISTLEMSGRSRFSSPISVLAANSDGELLVGGDQEGAIYVMLFQSLERLYRLESPDRVPPIVGIACLDDKRVVDIRGRHCTVWRNPSVHIDRHLEQSSYGLHEASERTEGHIDMATSYSPITVLLPIVDGDYLFLGRKDGTIQVSQVSTGAMVANLQSHTPSTEIRAIDWNGTSQLLASADTSGRCIIHRVTFVEEQGAQLVEEVLLDHQDQDLEPIIQILISPCSKLLLLRTARTVKVMSLAGDPIAEKNAHWRSFWMTHPGDPALIMSIENGFVRLNHWSTLALAFVAGVIVHLKDSVSCAGTDVWTCCPGSRYVAMAWSSGLGIDTKSFIASLDAAKLQESSTHNPVLMRHVSLSMKCSIGLVRNRLIFLDSFGWVCSIALDNHVTSYKRHFFLPSNWCTGEDLLMCLVSETAVALASGGHIFIFQGFLEMEHAVELDKDRGSRMWTWMSYFEYLHPKENPTYLRVMKVLRDAGYYV